MSNMEKCAVIYGPVGGLIAIEDLGIPGIEMGIEVQNSNLAEMRVYRAQSRESNSVIPT